jgi:hypothetical protein
VSEKTTLTDPIPQTTQQTQTITPEKISAGIETEAPLEDSVPGFSLTRPGTLLDSEPMMSANHVASSEINPNPVCLGRDTMEESRDINFSSMLIETPLNPDDKNLTESGDFSGPQNLKENLSKILMSSMEPQLTLIKSKKEEIEKQGLSWGAFESYADSLMKANQKLQSNLFTIPDANEDLFDSMKTDEIQVSLKTEQPKEADPFKPSENEQKLLAEIEELKSQVESLGEGLSRKNRVLEQFCQVEKTLKKENGDLSSKVGDLTSEVDRLKTNYKEKVYVLESELTELREKNSMLNLTSKNLRVEKKEQFSRMQSLIFKEGYVLSQTDADFHLSHAKDSQGKSKKLEDSTTHKSLEEENGTLKTLLKDTQDKLELVESEVSSLRYNEKQQAGWLEDSIKLNAKLTALEERLSGVLIENREYADKLSIQESLVINFQSLLKDNSVNPFFFGVTKRDLGVAGEDPDDAGGW